MKKILAILAAASLVLTMTACGGNGDAGSSVTQGGAAVDEKGNEIPGTTIDGAGKEVDMSKLDGVTLKEDKEANRTSEGELGSYNVSIDDAKVIEAGEGKVLVVAFTYKNESSEPAAFANVFTVETTQNGSKLGPCVINMEGINVLSGVEIIDSGKTTKVQKTYVITDEETPVEVLVYKYGEPAGDNISKVFNLK